MRSGEEAPICGACFEPIAVIWDHEREEWIARGAVRDGDELFHARCIAATHDDSVNTPAATTLKRTAEDAELDSEEPNAKRSRSEPV